MNYSEIEAKLLEMNWTPEMLADYVSGDGVRNPDWEGDRYDDEACYSDEQIKEILAPFGEIKQVEHFGGEGEGETYFYIVHFVDHDVYVRCAGHYTSYDGVDWYDDFKECEKVPKTGYEFRNK